MAGFLGTLLEKYHAQMERHHNQPFLEATMAACAMVATDDGQVSFSESVRVDQILETLDALKVFDPHEGVNLFRDYCDKILEKPKEGHAIAVTALDAVRGDEEKSSLLIRICLAVAEADGKASLVDRIEIVSICNRIGIDPESWGLSYDDLLAEQSAG